jgi:hypothetical protein
VGAVRRLIGRGEATGVEPLLVGRKSVAVTILDVATLYARPAVQEAVLRMQLFAEVPLAGIAAAVAL